jgi:hypothetical protein
MNYEFTVSKHVLRILTQTCKIYQENFKFTDDENKI